MDMVVDASALLAVLIKRADGSLFRLVGPLASSRLQEPGDTV